MLNEIDYDYLINDFASKFFIKIIFFKTKITSFQSSL